MKKFLRYFIVASFILGSIQIPFVRAEEILDENPLPNYSFEASVGIASLSRDLALSAFENKLEVGMPGGQLLEPTVVKLTQLNETVKAPAAEVLQTPCIKLISRRQYLNQDVIL